jgi:hypothetical protein
MLGELKKVGVGEFDLDNVSKYDEEMESVNENEENVKEEVRETD